MKKLNQFLNILLSILLGIFIGNCIFTVMDHQMNPAAYAAQSAPWYTGLLTQGLFVLAAVVIFMTVKILLAKKGKAQKNRTPIHKNFIERASRENDPGWLFVFAY